MERLNGLGRCIRRGFVREVPFLNVLLPYRISQIAEDPPTHPLSNGHRVALFPDPFFICFLTLPKGAKKCKNHPGKPSDPLKQEIAHLDVEKVFQTILASLTTGRLHNLKRCLILGELMRLKEKLHYSKTQVSLLWWPNRMHWPPEGLKSWAKR